MSSNTFCNNEELLEEHGTVTDHSTIQRWVVKYSPLLENEFRKKHKTPTGRSWRKRIIKPMLGFKSFASAKATIAGIELHHMIKKGQMSDAVNMPIWEQFYSLAA